MKTITQETKQKISESMKRAHAEGRAHNIGQSRWNNAPSYPESWFIKVIENEFEDKSYQREYPFYKYSLDFAWPDKKFCVEIDGDQHYRGTAEGQLQQKRDLEKDALLKVNGWYEIRIPWKTICLNTKDFIAFVKNALNSLDKKDISAEPWYLHNHNEHYCQICGCKVSEEDRLCHKCAAEKNRKVDRPTKLELAEKVYTSNYTAVGATYGVSANAVIKWCKEYHLPVHIFDLKNWYRVNILKLPPIIKQLKKQYEKKAVIIQQCDKHTGRIIAEYNNYTEAAKKCGVSDDNISRVCRGLRKTAGGYIWKLIKI